MKLLLIALFLGGCTISDLVPDSASVIVLFGENDGDFNSTASNRGDTISRTTGRSSGTSRHIGFEIRWLFPQPTSARTFSSRLRQYDKDKHPQ